MLGGCDVYSRRQAHVVRQIADPARKVARVVQDHFRVAYVRLVTDKDEVDAVWCPPWRKVLDAECRRALARERVRQAGSGHELLPEPATSGDVEVTAHNDRRAPGYAPGHVRDGDKLPLLQDDMPVPRRSVPVTIGQGMNVDYPCPVCQARNQRGGQGGKQGEPATLVSGNR